MDELSLHILDIAQNSVAAGAGTIELSVIEAGNRLTVTVTDDGRGMDESMLKSVTSPFTTSRTTRSVGLGLPLLKMTCEMTGGDFLIESEAGRGTRVRAVYITDSVDCLPLGDMASTVMLLVQQRPDAHLIYRREKDGAGFTLDTDEMRILLEGVPLDSPEVLDFIMGFVGENEQELGQ